MALRPYQLRTIAAAREAARTHRRLLVVSPTGSGKTSMGVAIVHGALQRGKRVLWLAHRRELIAQASERLHEAGAPHGIILAGKAGAVAAPMQVASVQTLTARDARPPADVLVWDECHHCAAATYTAIRDAYPDAFHVGLTATPERSDGAALGDAFDVLVEGPTVRELTELGFLVPCDAVAPAMRNKDLAQDPVRAWQTHTPGRPTILFASNIPHSVATVMAFRAAGVAAEHVDGDTPMAVREAAIRRFASGETMVLSNVYVFTEGFDCTRAEVCLLARGASHPSVYLQMVGRVLRPHPGKTSAVVLDLCGVVHEHGLPDEERKYSLDGDAIRRTETEPTKQCPTCGAVFRPAPECPRCHYAFPPPELPAVGNRELQRILRPSATQDEKQATYDRLAKVARERGYKAGWLAHRFRATYGHWPNGLRETRPEPQAEERQDFDWGGVG